MSKSIYVLLAAVALVVLAAALNPSAEQHRAKITAAVAQRSPIAGVLQVGAVMAFLSNYHSVGVASYTLANDRTISWGAFGMVFVLE